MIYSKCKNRLKVFTAIMLIIAIVLCAVPASRVEASSDVTFGGVTYRGVTVDEQMAWAVLDLVNAERSKAGLQPLVMDQKLMDTAVGRSCEITVLFDHQRPNGQDCFSVYPSGYYYYGENIAAGYVSAESVVNAWMNSSGHRANILSKDFKSIGIGCVKSDDGRYYVYWTQCFGGRVLQEASRPFTVDGLDYSDVFDAKYYLNRYSDLRSVFGSDEAKAFNHFVKYGMKEGRQGSASFNVDIYKKNYPDLMNLYGNDNANYYRHYILYGKREKRNATSRIDISPSSLKDITVYNGVDYQYVYDVKFYASKYPDLRAAFGSDSMAYLKHFVNSGMREGRQGKESFDVKSYRNLYSDLRRAFGKDLKLYYMHFITNGHREGRRATGCTTLQNAITVYNGVDYGEIYDFTYYQNKYPDIKKAFGDDEVATLKHFVNNGLKEGRKGKDTSFNIYQYIVNYPDLRKAYKYNYAAYYEHYIRRGKAEKRTASGNATIAQARQAIKDIN